MKYLTVAMKLKNPCPYIYENAFVLCNNIRYLREYYRYSQTTLANKVGVSRKTIASLERGDTFPTAELASLLCFALNIDFENLFYYQPLRINN